METNTQFTRGRWYKLRILAPDLKDLEARYEGVTLNTLGDEEEVFYDPAACDGFGAFLYLHRNSILHSEELKSGN